MVKKIFAKGYVTLILCIMYAPIFVLIAFSFTESTLIGNWSGVSLELYKKLFENEQVMTALKNTILIALASAVVSTILGTLGAVGVYYCKKRIRKGVEFIGQVPILNPEIVTALSLTILFVFLGVRFNFITLLIGHVVLTIPFVVLSITPKLKQMDPNVYEAALDLGAKPSMALRKVVLPEIIPGVLSGFVLAITLSLDDYIITAFTRNNSFQTISTYVYGVTAKKGALPPTLRALTTIIFLFTLLLLIFINIRSKKKEVKR